MIEQHFGESAPWSLGVEEEVLILDAETLALSPGVETLLTGVEGQELPGVLKMELLASMVELATGVCSTPQEALAALRDLRAAADESARASGLRVAAAGTHPFSLPQAQDIAPDPRYREFVEYAGITARRQAVCGLHLHVSMPGPEECLRALEGVLPWLPLVLALSANSPYLAGEETGLASARAEVLALLPRASAPPVFASYAEWEAFVERFVRIGLADGYTRFWWDIRPAPRFGTLEVRAPDQPTSVERTAALVALLQALCVTILAGESPAPANRGDYAQNRWAALRFGPRAQLIHPDGERLVGVEELTQELLELVEPAARELGGAEALAALDPGACEGDRQLEVGRARGLEAVVADVAERTVRST
ncbi:MAG TPA: YbdK family carboxylate-amine ligase [Gaiellaceae bacterium]|nr:YbdK family carboxylate-amine ligase [Gaiellaceae bacterium]